MDNVRIKLMTISYVNQDRINPQNATPDSQVLSRYILLITGSKEQEG